MQKKPAKHKLITDSEGKLRYRFFCDLSGALEYTSRPINADSEKNLNVFGIKKQRHTLMFVINAENL